MKSTRIYKKKGRGKKKENMESPAVWSAPSTPVFINSAPQQSQYFPSLSITYALQYLLSPSPKVWVSLRLLRALAINIGGRWWGGEGASVQSGRKESTPSLPMPKVFFCFFFNKAVRFDCRPGVIVTRCGTSVSPRRFPAAALDAGQRGCVQTAGPNLISLERKLHRLVSPPHLHTHRLPGT